MRDRNVYIATYFLYHFIIRLRDGCRFHSTLKVNLFSFSFPQKGYGAYFITNMHNLLTNLQKKECSLEIAKKFDYFLLDLGILKA